MKYKFINENKIEPAPKTLMELYKEDGKQLKRVLFTPSAEAYERQGYYELVEDPYPDDSEYAYTHYYEQGNPIRKRWRRGEPIEPPEPDATTAFMQTLSNPDTNSIAKIRQAAKAFLEATEGVTDEH